MNITVEGHSTTVTAPVSVANGPAITVGVEVPERPELSFEVLVEPEIINVSVQAGQSGNQSFTHTQSTPAATWTIPNTPGSKAIVLGIYDNAGRMGLADVIVTNTNTVITFSQPRTGSVDFIRG